MSQEHDPIDRERPERALRESETRYRALAEHASDIVCEIDEDLRIVFINHALERITGIKPESVIGKTLVDLVEAGLYHPDDAAGLLERARLLISQEAQAAHTRLRMRHTDGDWRWIDYHGSSFRTQGGKRHRVVLGREVTELLRREDAQAEYAEQLEQEVQRRTEALEKANAELRRLQVRLVFAERIGAAEEIAARMAHAVNNPLAALLGSIELEIDASGQENPRLLQIRRIAHRIRDVLENTLTMVREGHLKLADEAPATLLEEVRDELAARAASSMSRIEVELEPNLPEVNVDRTLLCSALVSLAENGLDAMKPGGGGRLLIRVVREDDLLRFLVRDEGPGIPPEAESSIFEPFFTTKPSGTGLGLAIAQGIIRGHGGRLTVRNHQDGGVLSVMTLPVSAAPPARGAAQRT